MGALLKIVQTPSVSSQESACRVLSTDVVDRLCVMNTAVRTLRAMSYRVLAQTLFPVRGSKPEVRIDRSHQTSIGPLLDRSCGHHWHTVAGKKYGFTEFQGVTVTWEEA